MGKRGFDDDELHWYAIDVMRQKEFVAGYIFNQMGWVTFIPTATRFRKKTRYSKGKIEVAYAELPGVVFVGFPTAPDWFRVMSMHLVNGVLSVDDRPRRIDTAGREWLDYRAYRADGHMTLERQMVLYRGQEVERSVPLVSVQGRGVLRSPAALKIKAAKDRPIVIRAAGERAKLLAGILRPADAQVAKAA